MMYLLLLYISFWIEILFSLIGNIQTVINTAWNINKVVWKMIRLAKLKETDYTLNELYDMFKLTMYPNCKQNYVREIKKFASNAYYIWHCLFKKIYFKYKYHRRTKYLLTAQATLYGMRQLLNQ